MGIRLLSRKDIMYFLKLSLCCVLAFSFSANAFQLAVSDLSLPANQSFEIPKGTTKIAFSHLTMQTGSALIVPENINDIEITVDNGIFYDDTSVVQRAPDNTTIASQGQKGGAGNNGANINVVIKHAAFKFSKFGDNESDPKFLIISKGGTGAQSGAGAVGSNAATSNCGSVDNGHSASRGGPGVQGGVGGNGGSIIATITLTKNHPTLSDKQIRLMSIGGSGGPGGPGGAGGGGSGEKCCAEVWPLGCTWKRGGYPPAGPGDAGAMGDAGNSGKINLQFDFEH